MPRGLLRLEQWDALELDPTRRWELSAGTLIISPRPHPRHQRISRRLTRLLEDHLPDGLEAVPEIEVTTSASFPPSVRDPDLDPDAPPHDRFLAYHLDGEKYRRVTALDGGLILACQPTEMEFTLDVLTGRWGAAR